MAAAAAGLAATGGAAAQSTLGDFKLCSWIEDSDRRLDCYDEVASRPIVEGTEIPAERRFRPPPAPAPTAGGEPPAEPHDDLRALYAAGLSPAATPERVRALLAEAADRGFPVAQHLMAGLLLRDRDADAATRRRAVTLLRQAARAGHALSRFRLGQLLWEGDLVAGDRPRAYAWMRLAAEDGLGEARRAARAMANLLAPEEHRAADRLADRLRADGIGGEDAPNAVLAAAEMSVPVSASETTAAESRATDSSGDAPPAGETESAPSAAAGGWRLQVASFRDRSVAEAECRRLTQEGPEAARGLACRIVPADLGARGRFYRLQLGRFDDERSAEARCDALKAAGLDCLPRPPAS